MDAAAGLRERVSSSLYCENLDDPFAAAVRADAERRAGSLTVRQHLRLRWPDTTGWAVAAVVIAMCVFLVPDGLLRSQQAQATVLQQTQLQQTRVEIKKHIDDVKKMAQTNPALADLQADLEKLDTEMMGKMDRPADLRHEAIKKIDRVADAVREKRKDERFDKVSETKRMLRALQEPNGDKTPVQKLTRDLAAGDFKAANETIKKMKEQLATLKKDSDKEFVAKMQKQLDQLAKQMESLEGYQRIIAEWSIRANRADVGARNTGGRRPIHRKLLAYLARRVFSDKVKRIMGFSNSRLAFCGAVSADPEMLAYFSGFDIVIREVYGLSEATGPSVVTREGATRFGTVGHPMPGVEISLADDGEILIRGRSVRSEERRVGKECRSRWSPYH